MARNDDGPERGRLSRKLAQEAHAECVGAQWRYMHALGTGSGVAEHQEAFHDALLSFYKVLQHKLGRLDSVSQYWDERPVMEWTPVIYAEGEDESELVAKRAPVDTKGQDSYLRTHTGDIRSDEEGRPLFLQYEPSKTGLRHLEGWIGRVHTEGKQIDDSFGTRYVESGQPQVLPRQLLFRCMIALEEAADEIGLLFESKTPVADPSEAVV